MRVRTRVRTRVRVRVSLTLFLHPYLTKELPAMIRTGMDWNASGPKP